MAQCHDCRGHGCMADGPVCRTCKGSGENGVDPTIDRGREQEIARREAPKLCLKRVGNGQWCQVEAGHPDTIPCASDASGVYGPIEAVPPVWRKHRGQSEVKPKAAAPAISEPPKELIV